MNKFGVVIVTYKRQNGTTFDKISRAIKSLNAQTYKDWKLFLIGDNYNDKQEFQKIVDLLPPDKITAINLPFAAERESGKFSGHSLWCSAGANASNVGMEQSLKEGYNIHTHLDDDDIWREFHLDTLNFGYNNFPEAVYVYTNAYYKDRHNSEKLFPQFYNPYIEYNNFPPKPESLIHSAASWKLDKIPFRHRNVLEQGRDFPGDADMWERINKYCQEEDLKTLYIPITTVIKDSEFSDY